MKVYKLIRCPKCQASFITQAVGRCSCQTCHHSFKLMCNILALNTDIREVQAERARILARESRGTGEWERLK